MSVNIRRQGGVGESVKRIDGVPKVKGEFEYASDLHRDGMLWGATLRSPHPHAQIISIDVSAAAAAPGVSAVLTHADVPGRPTFGLDVQDQPVLARDVVRYAGEAVAIVAAEDPELAREALAKIAVNYKALTPVTDMEQARLHLSGVGGAFGAREDVSMQVHACLLALRTKRPVKMSYGRQESFYGHVHRHPSRVWMRHGARRDGTLVSVQARLLVDGGAYTSTSPAVIGNATTFAAGPYEVPNARLEGTAVFTNNPPCGAMRGFGAVQACFAYEAQMDKLAAALKLDPIELRLKNALRSGSVLPTGQPIAGVAPVRECLQRLQALPHPPEESALDRDPMLLPGGAGNG